MPRPRVTGIVEARPLVRAAARRRRDRLRADLLPVTQTALAAALAWGIARQVHDVPFFAPVAAVIALGVGRGQRTRRAIELTLGVTLGILVADLLVTLLGSGPAVVALVVAGAMLAAILIGAGDLFVAQAAVSAVIVATIELPEGGFRPDRALDAAIGGAVALLVGQVLFRQNPERRLARAAVPLAEALSEVLRATARALRDADPALAREALVGARAADGHLAAFEDAIVQARETLGGRTTVPRYALAAEQLGFATRNVRVLARRGRATLRKGTPPPEVAEAVDRLADAMCALVDELRDGEDGQVGEHALAAAALANRALQRPDAGLQTAVLVGQVRSTAVDLLRGAGTPEDAAMRAVDGAG